VGLTDRLTASFFSSLFFRLRSRREQSPKSFLDRVSTGSGSDLVKPPTQNRYEIYRMPITDQVATLYMKGRPVDVSLELIKDFKLASQGEPYENVLCWHGRASRNDRDRRS